MAIVLTDSANYTAIANAIREKNGEETTYKPSEMAAAIEAISSGGGSGEETPDTTSYIFEVDNSVSTNLLIYSVEKDSDGVWSAKPTYQFYVSDYNAVFTHAKLYREDGEPLMRAGKAYKLSWESYVTYVGENRYPNCRVTTNISQTPNILYDAKLTGVTVPDWFSLAFAYMPKEDIYYLYGFFAAEYTDAKKVASKLKNLSIKELTTVS